LLTLVVEYLQMMYDEYMKPEWEHVLPMLQESVAAFQNLDFSNMTAYEAIRAVTGRDMTGKIDLKLSNVDRLVFVPTAHIGPYVGSELHDNTPYILFGALLEACSLYHLIEPLNLICLNALRHTRCIRIADTPRRTCTGYYRTSGLPTTTRHLSQLSATGISPNGDGGCEMLQLKHRPVMDMLRALTNFLSRQ
jgi:hypothetical protein